VILPLPVLVEFTSVIQEQFVDAVHVQEEGLVLMLNEPFNVVAE
jgi:hypothetical protein